MPAPVSTSADSRLSRTTRALSIGAGLTALGMGLLAPVLPLYARSLGAGATYVGLLLGGFGAARLLVPLPAVWLAGRIGRRRLLVGSPALTAPVAALCAVASGPWTLALFCIAEGGLAAVYATLGTGTILRKEGSEGRAHAMANYQAASLAGASLGPALGGVVGDRFGPQLPFLIYAVLAAAAAGWLSRELDGEQLVPHSDAGAQRLTIQAVWRLFSRPALLPMWLIAFGLVFARIGTQLTAAPLLGAWRLGLSPSAIGLALSAGALAGLAAIFPAGKLADRYGRKLAITAGAVGVALSLAIFALSTSYPVFVAAAVSLGVASSLAGPALPAYLADVVPEPLREACVALHRTFGDAGATIAPPMFGWLTDLGGFSLSLAVTAAAILMAAIALSRGKLLEPAKQKLAA